MRRKQKWLCLAVAGLLALGLLAGCGEASSTAEPMADEQHLAAQQAVTAPAIEMSGDIFLTTTEDMLVQVGAYVGALDDNIPPLPSIEPSIGNEDSDYPTYFAYITENLLLQLIDRKNENGQNLYVIYLPISVTASESEWAAAQDYFYAVSYYLDRERPGNLWQALGVAEATGPEDSNIISCNGITYEYGFSAEHYVIMITPGVSHDWEPNKIYQEGPLQEAAVND